MFKHWLFAESSLNPLPILNIEWTNRNSVRKCSHLLHVTEASNDSSMAIVALDPKTIFNHPDQHFLGVVVHHKGLSDDFYQPNSNIYMFYSASYIYMFCIWSLLFFYFLGMFYIQYIMILFLCLLPTALYSSLCPQSLSNLLYYLDHRL